MKSYHPYVIKKLKDLKQYITPIVKYLICFSFQEICVIKESLGFSHMGSSIKQISVFCLFFMF